jgi:hypothetical protein
MSDALASGVDEIEVVYRIARTGDVGFHLVFFFCGSFSLLTEIDMGEERL